MKKKVLLTLTLAFVLVFNIFSGCSFIGTNTDKYYNTVVAKVGDDVEITKYQLLTAYNNYGSEYMENYGYTVEQAVETLLDQIINREVFAGYIENNFSKIFGTDKLKKWEESEIWQDVFDYVNENQVLVYVNNIRKNLDLSEVSKEEANADFDEKFIRSEYYRSITIERNSVGEITKITPVAAYHDESLDLDINDFEFTFYGESSEQNRQINELAQQQFYYYLKTSSKDTSIKDNKTLLENHLKDLYKTYRQTYLVQKFEEHYNQSKEISLTSIVEKAKDLIRKDYQTYADPANKEAYISAVQGDASKIYFHPYEDELIYVSHILVKYDKNNEDYNLLNEYESKYNRGELTLQEYENSISPANLGNQCKVYQMVDGIFEDEPTSMNANDLYQMLQDELSSITNKKERLNAFIDYAYQYNQDTGMFSTSDFYTVQLDTNYTDTMVKNFADMSRELYNTNGEGSMGICFTEYGAHIIYIVGKVQNKIVNSINEIDTLTVDKLFNIKLLGNQYLMSNEENPDIDRTLLDDIANNVLINDYDTYQNTLVNEIKNSMGENAVIIYKNRYQDLFK